MEQTAVEWLAKELESYGDPQFCEIEWEQLDSLIKQAKEMERQQQDEFAIGFAEWYLSLWLRDDDSSFDNYSQKELLEIYKKEKGL
jgi:hypothetical protein